MRGVTQPRKPSVDPSQNVVPGAAGSSPAIFDAPPVENPFFTGRTEIISKLRETLSKGERAALSGMPGVGKTETATEYAHRYRGEYQSVFWVNADTRDALLSGYAWVASRLNLGLQSEPDQNKIANAVKQHLGTFSGWLFVLDNADDLAPIADLIPTSKTGHILITSRLPAFGSHATPIFLPELDEQEGATLLLRRARRLAKDAVLNVATPEDREAALELSRKMQGLPLALDQAGAYIEDVGKTPAQYLDLYNRRSADLLAKRGGNPTGHPDAVDVTFSLAFEKVATTNPAAAELLCACSFLAPDNIPEYIFMQIGLDWGNILGPVTVNEIEWDLALQTVRNLSLIRRESQTKLLSIHRLVQEFINNSLDDVGKRKWAERAVYAVDKAMPAVVYKNWSMYDLLLPHARNCAEMITLHQIGVVAAGRLLNQTAYYLDQRSQFEEAGQFYTKAFLFADTHLSDDNPNKAVSYNNLGRFYVTNNEDSKAEPMYQRAYDLLSRLPELSHHSIANVLNNLGELYGRRGRQDQAKAMLDKALNYQTKSGNIDTSLTAVILNNLANVYAQHRQYKHAQSLLLKARQIQNKVLLPEDPSNAVVLNSLAVTYSSQGKFREAEEAYQQAIMIMSALQGEQHPDLAPLIRNYALFLRAIGKGLEATTLEAKYGNNSEN